MRTIAIAAAALMVAALAGCASTATTTAARPLPTLSMPAASDLPNPAASTAPATPNPEGKYHGSCDYTLTTNWSGGGYNHLIGEISLRNTGNIGITVHASIAWPQEGYPPVTAAKDARLPYGAHRTLRFRVAVPDSGNVIDLLQSWQEHHGFRDGCRYHVKVTSTFGSAV